MAFPHSVLGVGGRGEWLLMAYLGGRSWDASPQNLEPLEPRWQVVAHGHSPDGRTLEQERGNNTVQPRSQAG